MADIKFEIIKEFDVLSQSEKGWAKELNLISGKDHEPEYDIRDCSPDGGKMSLNSSPPEPVQ